MEHIQSILHRNLRASVDDSGLLFRQNVIEGTELELHGK